jgi:transposase
MKITTAGIDLAKTVFQVHATDEHGKAVVKKAMKRDQVAKYFANLPPCLIGMEACGSAHHWHRQLSRFGHTVKLMAPQYVKPYVKTNKNDAADAEAICEAVGRPNMRFVAPKNIEQQTVLSLHAVRQGFVKARTAQGNQIRGLLAEFGIVINKGFAPLYQRLPDIVEDGENGLPGLFRDLLTRLLAHLKVLDRQVGEIELQIKLWHRDNEASQRLSDRRGIGPLTASALVATLGNGRQYKNGRQFAAAIGIVPRQHSSGGKPTLLGISKHGDKYLRTLLIHGARAVIRAVQMQATPSTDPEDQWLRGLLVRRHKNVVAVALAAKTARIVWALLAKGEKFDPDHLSTKPTGTVPA